MNETIQTTEIKVAALREQARQLREMAKDATADTNGKLYLLADQFSEDADRLEATMIDTLPKLIEAWKKAEHAYNGAQYASYSSTAEDLTLKPKYDRFVALNVRLHTILKKLNRVHYEGHTYEAHIGITVTPCKSADQINLEDMPSF